MMGEETMERQQLEGATAATCPATTTAACSGATVKAASARRKEIAAIYDSASSASDSGKLGGETVMPVNPIEKAWSKFKQCLRTAKARTAEALDQAITEALKTITADNAAAWFRHCGYGIQ
jgi:hypothetical protein